MDWFDFSFVGVDVCVIGRTYVVISLLSASRCINEFRCIHVNENVYKYVSVFLVYLGVVRVFKPI